jgi:peptide/nickel transport system substrate-binding protein
VVDATTRGIVPAHVLQDVAAAELEDAPFNVAPVGTGPFMINSGQDPQRNHRLRLSPNPVHWRHGIKLASVEFRFFSDDRALLESFAAGEIQAINNVSHGILPEIAAIADVRLFSASLPRLTVLLFNLSEEGPPALRPLEVRQALAYALDRDALIDRVLQGQGLLLEGPYLPSSWAYNPALLTPFQHQPVTATVMLESAGWVMPGGGMVRQREGVPLSLRVLTLDVPQQRDLAESIADQWQEVGVAASVTTVDEVSELRSELSNHEFDIALVEVAPAGDPDLYDFWSQEAIVSGQNYTGWNQQRASEALENGRRLWDRSERRPYYDAFLSHYDGDIPALTLYQHVYTYALSGEVHMAEIGRINQPRDRYNTLSDWFLLYRDITVSCPAEAST